MNYLEIIGKQFNNHVQLKTKRPGIIQLLAPLYYEDGDRVDIFLEESKDLGGKIRISDYGMTVMRLSYYYDLNTTNKKRIFYRILSENEISEANGNLYVDTPPDDLYPAILHFAQTTAKISSMRQWRKEVVHNLFFDMLEEVVRDKLGRFDPQHPYYPLPNHEEYEVDYCFNGSEKPVYLFGVNSAKSAQLATISCLRFQNENLKFYGAVVLEDLDILNKKDQARLMSAADKQFPSLDDLREKGKLFLERKSG